VLQALANGTVLGMDLREHTGLQSDTVYPQVPAFRAGRIREVRRGNARDHAHMNLIAMH
jgi:hypothetical protein